MSDLWSDPSSTSILNVCEQRRLWRDCADAPLVAYVISTIISFGLKKISQSIKGNKMYIFWPFRILFSVVKIYIVPDISISGANTWVWLSRGWSTENHICYYISKCSSWPIVFKSSVCHLGKTGITPVFKMASKTATGYRNDPRNNNACLNQILSIKFCF